MPMYFPDLRSVQSLAKSMQKNTGDKRYNGIFPKNENQLSQARKELAQYFRNVWSDECQAMEVEEAVTKENYDEAMTNAVRKRFAF